MLVILFVIIIGCIVHFLYDAFKEKDEQFNKIKRNFLLLNDWMDLSRAENHALASLLWKKGYKEIMIYGWSFLGEQLYKDLEGTQIKVKGILDRRTVTNVYNIPTYSLNSKLPKVDAVIITVLYDGEKIKNDLAKVVKCPAINLEELV